MSVAEAADAPRSRAFEPWEVAVALACGAMAIVGGGVAARLSALEKAADAPAIDKGAAVPMRVVPVLDLDHPMLKLGTSKVDPAKLMDRWNRRTPKPRAAEQAFVSTKAGKEATDAPAPSVKVADAGTPPPPPDAAPILAQTIPDEATDAAPAVTNVKGHEDGDPNGTETDPLKAQAVSTYLGRLTRHFTKHFRGVRGTGLAEAELLALKAKVVVQLTPERRVGPHSMKASGNAAFDAAVNAALASAKAEDLPPPPENYPDILRSSVSITFVCTKGQCD